ncbi:Scr1 family TA system antitoxin-like transcriptional regulator [Streptomyces sp. BV333]|uniref:Scr1 family TA system antitoxin-like transcriptional regulator n=1 Tax=Streptomyces sp. BV333 TaxID=2849673 RepID=UPI0027DF8B9E|nr:Scr1 family TA system antitoxin-like transcriptional regulator [Streptomyces sp. BV333]
MPEEPRRGRSRCRNSPGWRTPGTRPSLPTSTDFSTSTPSSAAMWTTSCGPPSSTSPRPVLSAAGGTRTEASSVCMWQMGTIPGLLQTGDYAREFIRTTAMSDGVQAKVDALVEVRPARQAALTRERPVDLWATLAEAALRVRVKDQGVMREQLSHHPTARPSPEGRAVSRRAGLTPPPRPPKDQAPPAAAAPPPASGPGTPA